MVIVGGGDDLSPRRFDLLVVQGVYYSMLDSMVDSIDL